MAPGASVEEAQTELMQLKDRLHAEYPEAYPEKQRYGMAVALLRDEITREARPTLLILLSMARFILIIACANVANIRAVDSGSNGWLHCLSSHGFQLDFGFL